MATSPPGVRLALAEFDYVPSAEALAEGEEIQITEGDKLWVIEEGDEDWTKVRLLLPNNELSPSGLVPTSYLTPLPPIRHVTALYDYTPSPDTEELELVEGEQLEWFEDDGDWALVAKVGGGGAGYVPASYVGEEGEGAGGEEEEEEAPVVETQQEYVSPEEKVGKTKSGAGVATWSVTELDKKKKKKKGTLGIGNGMIFFASESDKTPVAQYPITTLSSHNSPKSKHLVLIFPSPTDELHFVFGSSEDYNAMIERIKEETAPPRIVPPPSTLTGTAPSLSSSTTASPPGGAYIPPPPPIRSTATPTPSAPTPATSQKKKGNALALYDFAPAGTDEIELTEGERLDLVELAVGGDEDWVKVRKLNSGEEGVVPASYVELDEGASLATSSNAITSSAPLTSPEPLPSEEEPLPSEEEEGEGEDTSAAEAAAAASAAKAAAAAKEREKERERRKRLEEMGPARPIPVPTTVERERPSSGQGRREVKEERRDSGREERREKERRRDTKSSTTNGNGAAKTPNPSSLRTWSDRTGQFKVSAEFLGMSSDNKKIRLHKANGVVVEVPLEKMSDSDRKYLRSVSGGGGGGGGERSGERRRRERGGDDDDDVPLEVVREREKSNGDREREKEKERQRLILAQQQQKSKGPQIDWFEFFLAAQCSPDDCTRYASNFSREKIEESLLPDLESSTLRTLGLREGDIIRVLRYCKEKYPPRLPEKEKSVGGGGGGTGPTPPAPNLFTNADGGLKNNTASGRGRRGTTSRSGTGGVDAAALASAGAELEKASGTISPSVPTSTRREEAPREERKETNNTGGFDDDAWTPRPSSSKPSTPAPPAPISPPAPTPVAEPTRSASAGPPSSSTAGLTYNDGLLAQLGIPANPQRPPSAPLPLLSTSPTMMRTGSGLGPNGARGPVLPIAANQPLLAPLVPTPTFNGGAMGRSPFAGGMPMNALQPNMTGYPGAMGGGAFGVLPVMSQPTGYGGMMAQPISMQQTGFISPQPQPISMQQTGFVSQPQPSFLQPQQTFQQPQQQPSFQTPSPSFNAAPPNRFNSLPPQQQQPIQFNPAPPTSNSNAGSGYNTPTASSSTTGQFQPTNIFASMKDGTFANAGNKLGPQDSGKYDALRPQPTGFNQFQPGGLQPQMTGYPMMMQPQQTGFPGQQQQQQGQMFPQQTGMFGQQQFGRQF